MTHSPFMPAYGEKVDQIMVRLYGRHGRLQVRQSAEGDAELHQFPEVDQIVLQTILQSHVQRDDIFQVNTTTTDANA